MLNLRKLVNNSNVKNKNVNSFADFRKELLKDSIEWDIFFNNKSPCYNKKNVNIQKNIFGDSFVYERNITYDKIEKKYNCLFVNENVKKEILLFNSGMAAICSIIKTYIEGYRERKINILYTYGYFETDKFFRKLNFPVFCKPVYSEIELKNEIASGNVDILFLEPVSYGVDMQTYDIYSIIKLYNDTVSTDKIKMIVLDITLISHLNIDADRIQKILTKNNVFCVFIQSLIKLYQFGLELTNAGLAVLINNFAGKSNIDAFNVYLKTIKENRTIYSTNLTLSSLRILSNDFLYNKYFLDRYIKTIYNNNKVVANNLNNIKFKKISHPVLKKNKTFYTDIPFILITLKKDLESEYDEFIYKILKEIHNKKLPISYGSSFGFYNTRIEKIIYNISEKKCFLKVSVGYNSKYLNNIIHLLNNT